MQLAYFSVIALVAILSPVLPVLILWKQIQNQNRMIQTLTNLAASKSLETFQNLQWTEAATSQNQPLSPKSQSELVEEAILDDESIAHALAEKYKRMGWDPNRAYNQDEDVDFATEFGLNP